MGVLVEPFRSARSLLGKAFHDLRYRRKMCLQVFAHIPKQWKIIQLTFHWIDRQA